MHVYEDCPEYEDVSGGMTIMIRLKGSIPEMRIVQGAAGEGKLDTLINHRSEDDGYLLKDVLLPGLFFPQWLHRHADLCPYLCRCEGGKYNAFPSGSGLEQKTYRECDHCIDP